MTPGVPGYPLWAVIKTQDSKLQHQLCLKRSNLIMIPFMKKVKLKCFSDTLGDGDFISQTSVSVRRDIISGSNVM